MADPWTDVSRVPPESIDTPIGVIDVRRVRANAEKVGAYCDRYGLSWRPHIKTHKSTRVAEVQLRAGARGLTVATPREAEVMAQVCDDLLLAYPPVGDSKLTRLMALPSHVRLSVGLDSVEVLKGLAAAAVAARREVGVLIELDVGLGRVGVQSLEALVRLARAARELEGVRYQGIMFYPGHIRMPTADQGAAIVALAQLVSEARAALDTAGLAPAVVSGGSTPTLRRSHEIPALTEVRSGSSIFYDREGVAVGVATTNDLAYTVLATVVSSAVAGRAVVDAGSKALSKEGRAGDESYGVLLDRPEVRLVGLSEEHGILDLSTTSWRPRIGERVRIVPNHVCVSVNLQDHLMALDGATAEIWPLEARGRGPFVA